MFKYVKYVWINLISVRLIFYLTQTVFTGTRKKYLSKKLSDYSKAPNKCGEGGLNKQGKIMSIIITGGWNKLGVKIFKGESDSIAIIYIFLKAFF